MAGILENLKKMSPKSLADYILKLSDNLKGYPFLTTIVISIFGIPFIVVVITLAGKSDIVLIICLSMFFTIAVIYGLLESKVKNNVIMNDKNDVKRGLN
jgi:hypothetical protein